MAASRGYVNQRLLLGPETVIGTAVAATKDFPSPATTTPSAPSCRA